MRVEAIVYTSQMGHTRRCAQLLGENTGLPVYALEQAEKELKRGSGVIYLGWLCASHIKSYKRAARSENTRKQGDEADQFGFIPFCATED